MSLIISIIIIAANNHHFITPSYFLFNFFCHKLLVCCCLTCPCAFGFRLGGPREKWLLVDKNSVHCSQSWTKACTWVDISSIIMLVMMAFQKASQQCFKLYETLFTGTLTLCILILRYTKIPHGFSFHIALHAYKKRNNIIIMTSKFNSTKVS